MDKMLEFLSQPWPWYVSGALIALNVFIMTYFGRKFGISGFYEATCSYLGAGKISDFFKRQYDEKWRLFFIIGAILGGYLANQYIPHPDPIAISAQTIEQLKSMNIAYPPADNQGYLPTDYFNFGNIKFVILSLIAGILIGFGTRYGKGCTSGHAITGLSHLKIESLVTVIGFFIGGVIMTWLILPLLF